MILIVFKVLFDITHSQTIFSTDAINGTILVKNYFGLMKIRPNMCLKTIPSIHVTYLQ